MNKKITGDDLICAIGEINESLLIIPTKEARRRRFIKSLTVAASIVICLSVILGSYFNLVMRGANASDPNFSPGKGEGDMNCGNADGPQDEGSSDVALLSSVTVTVSGDIIPYASNFVVKDADGCFTLICEASEDTRPLATVSGETVPFTDNAELRIFKLRGSCEVTVISDSYNGDLVIIITEHSDCYEFKIK